MHSQADKLLGKSNEDLTAAKFGIGKLGDVAVDVGAFGAQMVPEMALGAVTGGVGGLAAMGAVPLAAGRTRHGRPGPAMGSRACVAWLRRGRSWSRRSCFPWRPRSAKPLAAGCRWAARAWTRCW